MQLTCLQFVFAAIIAWIFGLGLEIFPTHFSVQMLWELAYCGIGATLIALTLMNVGIKYAAPEYASLFMSTESGFGCLFGVIFLNETLSGRMWGRMCFNPAGACGITIGPGAEGTRESEQV